jgi:hypothetical protein
LIGCGFKITSKYIRASRVCRERAIGFVDDPISILIAEATTNTRTYPYFAVFGALVAAVRNSISISIGVGIVKI